MNLQGIQGIRPSQADRADLLVLGNQELRACSLKRKYSLDLKIIKKVSKNKLFLFSGDVNLGCTLHNILTGHLPKSLFNFTLHFSPDGKSN